VPQSPPPPPSLLPQLPVFGLPDQAQPVVAWQMSFLSIAVHSVGAAVGDEVGESVAMVGSTRVRSSSKGPKNASASGSCHR